MTRLFAALLGITYLWVILTPIVPAIARAGMERFNLLTGNFAAWALQQPVPSMYNFANTGIVVTDNMEDRVVPIPTNHFPTRRYTFEFRSSFQPSLPLVLRTSSTYQGETVRARHLIQGKPEGGAVMILSEE